VKYTNIFPNKSVELANSSGDIFAKSAKISPDEFADHAVVRKTEISTEILL